MVITLFSSTLRHNLDFFLLHINLMMNKRFDKIPHCNYPYMKEKIMKKSDVITILKNHRVEFEQQFNVAALSLFGSVVRDEAGPDSDVDFLVEFTKPVGLFQFIGLQQRLEELLDCRVDIGTPRSLKLHLRDDVLQEAIRVA